MADQFAKITINPPLAEFRRQLAAIEGRWNRKLRDVNLVAARIAMQAMRDRYSSVHPPLTGAGARSFRALATQNRAQVAFGDSRAPYVAGQDFGSGYHRRFGERVKPDRFGFAVLPNVTPKIIEEHGKALDDVVSEAFSD